MDNIETVADELLLRAEYMEGHLTYEEYTSVSLAPVFFTIAQTLGATPARWINAPELAMWQSLLTREVILTGGL